MVRSFARKAVLAGLTSFLIFFLFTLALSVGVMRLVGQPEDIKGLIDRSGVFENVVPNLLDDAEKNTRSDEGLSLKNPTIKSAAEKVFTPDYLHTTVNQTIDDIYLWLGGKSNQPPINIDLTTKKAAFASEVAAAVEQRAKTLSKCTRANTPISFDPLTADCLPAGVSAAQAAADAKREILSQEDFLKDPVISASDIKSKGGQPIFESQFKDAPKAYQKAKLVPYILVTLIILAAAGIIFLSLTRHQGLRRVGIILVIIGVFMMVLAWALDYAVNEKLLPQITEKYGALGDSFKTVIKDAAGQINNNHWLFGGSYVLFGGLAIAGSVFLGRRSGAKPLPEPAPEVAAEQKAPPRPAKRKIIKIQ